MCGLPDFSIALYYDLIILWANILYGALCLTNTFSSVFFFFCLLFSLQIIETACTCTESIQEN